jgi:formate dehydrogenase
MPATLRDSPADAQLSSEHTAQNLMDQIDDAAGTREILECWLEGRPIRDEYLIVSSGGLAGAGAHSYKL